MIKKKNWIIIALVFLTAGIVALLLWPKPGEVPKKSEEVLKIRIPHFGLHSIIGNGFTDFFGKEGFRVEKYETPQVLPKNTLSALLAEELDYAIFHGIEAPLVIDYSLKGAPIKTIMLIDGGRSRSLVAQAEIKDLEDINTIGIPSLCAPLCVDSYIARKFIEEHNLEVKIIASPEPPPASKPGTNFLIIQDWLVRGEIDALFTHPWNAHLLQKQGFQILNTSFYALPAVLSVRQDKIEKNPEEVQRIIRALENSIEFMLTEPEKTKELYSKFYLKHFKSMLPETDEEIQAQVEVIFYYDQIAFKKAIPNDKKGAELLIQIVKAGEFETSEEVERQVVTQEELDKVFDFRFVR